MIRADLGDGAEVRPLADGDVAGLFAVVDAERERLREWLPWVDRVRSVEDERCWLEGLRAAGRDLEGLGIFVGGRVVGTVGIRVDPFRVVAELGYWVAAAHEGRGLVTRACRLLIEHAFRDLGVHKVVIRAAPGNARSRAVASRLGFVQEAVLREEGLGAGGFHDLVVYGMLDREWPS